MCSIRGREGKFCCCSTTMGIHFSTPIHIGMFIYYMILFVASAQHDDWNWVILIWTFVIGLPRIILSFMLFQDSIYRRKWYAMCMVSTTTIQGALFLID